MWGWYRYVVIGVSAFCCTSTCGKKILNPVILVPGDGGSQFEARWDKPSVVHRWCTQTEKDWSALWLNLELLAPFVLDCLADNMRLVYDNLTHTSSNSPGVETRQIGFGNTSTVEYLDAYTHYGTSYFYYIVEDLVKDAGYTRNVNIRGAPYDFRKAPNEMGDFLKNLARLVEETYRQNNNTRVVLLAHSMGNLFSLYLLNHQSQAWKDKYIYSLVSLAGPWGGAAKVLRLMASGDNLNLFIVNPLSSRRMQRTMVSAAWLLPYDTFWNDTEVLVYSPHYNYTVRDYKRFMDDIDFPAGYLMRKDTEHLTKELRDPGVPVQCLHGVNVRTPLQMIYSKKQWYDEQPDINWGPGDGTVNLRSLHGCLRWRNVTHKQFDGAEHLKILDDKNVRKYLVSLLSS